MQRHGWLQQFKNAAPNNISSVLPIPFNETELMRIKMRLRIRFEMRSNGLLEGLNRLYNSRIIKVSKKGFEGPGPEKTKISHSCIKSSQEWEGIR